MMDPTDGNHDERGPRAGGEAPAPKTVRELVSRNVSRLRRDAQATVGDIAKAARHHGLDWSEAWITGIERGQKAISADHLLGFPIVLATALNHRVALADLLVGDEDVLIGSSTVPVSSVHLRDMITASPLRRSFSTTNETVPETPEMVEAARAARKAERLREILRAGLGDVDIRILSDAETHAGDAEDKVARKLGVPQAVIVAASAILWGRSMTEERAVLMAELPHGVASDAKARHAASVNRRLTGQLVEQLSAASRRVAAAELASLAGSAEEMPARAGTLVPES